MIHVWLLSKLIIIDMEKFKLADFKVSSIRIDDMLNVMGGSGCHTHNDTGTCGCLTCTTGADGDNKTCDMDTD